MTSHSKPIPNGAADLSHPRVAPGTPASVADAEATLLQLAEVFLQDLQSGKPVTDPSSPRLPYEVTTLRGKFPQMEARYRALVEQVPAVIFMAYLDRGVAEAYVSPQIEATLGFSQQEWLEDPVRWYAHIHPDDKQRWSAEAAEMFLSGKPYGFLGHYVPLLLWGGYSCACGAELDKWGREIRPSSE